MATNINLGADQHEATHPGQAIQCWKDAIQAVALKLQHAQPGDDNQGIPEYLSVLRGNLGAMYLKDYAEIGESSLLAVNSPDSFEFLQVDLFQKNLKKKQQSQSQQFPIKYHTFDDFFLRSAGLRTPEEARQHERVPTSYDMISFLDERQVDEEIERMESDLIRLETMREKIMVITAEKLKEDRRLGVPTHF